MRVFYALEFDAETKAYLFEKQKLIKERSVKGNFTLKENYHLTLKFIGEVEKREADALALKVDEIIDGIQSFNLNLNRIGKFEGQGRSIIWIGAARNREPEKMFQKLETVLSRSGYEKERRPFKPHITVGRQVILKQDDLSDIIISKEALISKVSLMESTRVDGTLRYIPLYSRLLE